MRYETFFFYFFFVFLFVNHCFNMSQLYKATGDPKKRAWWALLGALGGTKNYLFA